jgi:hypothetical protein
VVLDALSRKYELVANVTKEVWDERDAGVLTRQVDLHFDYYGGAWWYPTGSTTGCYNIKPKTGADVCSSTRPSGNGDGFDSCADGWCMDLSFTFQESFSHDSNFAFSTEMYQPWDPRLTQEKFAHTVQNALAHGLTGPNIVYPILSLGASYHRNTSRYPNINAMAKETLRGFPFFDMGNFGKQPEHGGGGTVLVAQRQTSLESSVCWQRAVLAPLRL